MSTPSELWRPEPFLPGLPWKLNALEHVSRVSRTTLVSAERVPPQHALINLAERGLEPRPRESSSDAIFFAAERLVKVVPSLHRAVLENVDGIGVIGSSGDDYDASHSEPAWPGWIFVSLPPPDARGPLRLAEGIIHEAMHLALTRFEDSSPLAASEARLYSPWKNEQRVAAGILHGLYVFICLACYFRQLTTYEPTSSDQALRRLREINAEIAMIDRGTLEQALTIEGRVFVHHLYATHAEEVINSPG